MDKNYFEQKLSEALMKDYRKTPETASVYELHLAVSGCVMDYIANDWENSRAQHLSKRRACPEWRRSPAERFLRR